MWPKVVARFRRRSTSVVMAICGLSLGVVLGVAAPHSTKWTLFILAGLLLAGAAKEWLDRRKVMPELYHLSD